MGSTCRRAFFVGTLALAAALALAGPALGIPYLHAPDQPEIPLGDARTYAIFAGAGIESTGTVTLSGTAGSDIGVGAGGSFVGSDTVTTGGTVHLGDARAEEASAALAAAIEDVLARTPVTMIPEGFLDYTGDDISVYDSPLWGRFAAGVYSSPTGAFGGESAGYLTLTLDAQGDPDGKFIFLAPEGLDLTRIQFRLINGAQAGHVWWVVGKGALVGAGPSVQVAGAGGEEAVPEGPSTPVTETEIVFDGFPGHVIGLGDIVVTPGSMVTGSLLTLDGTIRLGGETSSYDQWGYAAAGDILGAIVKNDSPVTSADFPVLYTTLNYEIEVSSPTSATITWTAHVINPSTMPVGGITLTSLSDPEGNLRALESPLVYVSGDAGDDGIMQPGEDWVYRVSIPILCEGAPLPHLPVLHAHPGIYEIEVRGTAMDGSGEAIARAGMQSHLECVPLEPEEPPTDSGGKIPVTGGPWGGLLLASWILAMAGALGLRRAACSRGGHSSSRPAAAGPRSG